MPPPCNADPRPHRRGAPLQPLLHAPHRRAARRPARQPFTLTESRLLWELAHRERTTASELASRLDLDAGYLSRLLRGLKRARPDPQRRPTARRPADAAAPERRRPARLRTARRALARRRRRRCSTRSARRQQQRCCGRWRRIEHCSARAPRGPPFLLRRTAPATSAGSARATVRCTRRSTAATGASRRWCADRGRLPRPLRRCARGLLDRRARRLNVGCVFLVQARDEAAAGARRGAAQLRMLLVEPRRAAWASAWRLVDECERFARGRLPAHRAVDQRHRSRPHAASTSRPATR